MKNRLMPADAVVIAVVLFVALLSAFLPRVWRADAHQVRISTEEDTTVYEMREEYDVEIVSHGIRLIVHISPNGVFVKDSECGNRVCVNSGKISRGGEVIVCAPAGVRIEMIAEGAADYVVG